VVNGIFNFAAAKFQKGSVNKILNQYKNQLKQIKSYKI
jgi:hypothetical protein